MIRWLKRESFLQPLLAVTEIDLQPNERVINKKDKDLNGLTVFHLAASYSAESLQFLLDAFIMDERLWPLVLRMLDVPSTDRKRTALHVAAKNTNSLATR